VAWQTFLKVDPINKAVPPPQGLLIFEFLVFSLNTEYSLLPNHHLWMDDKHVIERYVFYRRSSSVFTIFQEVIFDLRKTKSIYLPFV